MKVLHVVQRSLPILDGYSIRTKYIVENQALKGIKPVVVTSPYHKADDVVTEAGFEIIDGIRYYRTSRYNNIKEDDLSLFRYLKRYCISYNYLKELERISANEMPDVIHAHSDYLNGLRASQVGKKLGIPVLYEVRGLWAETGVANEGLTERSWKYKFINYMNKKAFHLVDHVCCLGLELRKELLLKGIRPEKLSVVHNAVDINKFYPLEKDPELVKRYQLDNTLVLGFIGSIRRSEGLDLLIEALPEILNIDPKLKVIIVGDGEPELQLLKEIAQKNHVSNKVEFVGRVPHAQILRYYSIIDVMVYPRADLKINQKVTPLKPLEAMAMKKVVLASDVGGLAELVEDGKTGILFKAEDKNDFINNCKRIILDRGLRTRVISNAYDWVRNTRDWHKVVDLYGPIYEKIFRSGRKPAAS